MWHAVGLAGMIALRAAVGAPTPAETVPFDHWAYDALERLVDLGLAQQLPGFDDPFHSPPTYTRYEFGLALARPIHSGAFAEAKAPKSADRLPVAALWAKLVREFWPEVVMIDGSPHGSAQPSVALRLGSLPADHWLYPESQALLVDMDAKRGVVPYVTPAPEPFPDVPLDHWACDAVEKLRVAEIVVGYPNGSFDGTACRGELQRLIDQGILIGGPYSQSGSAGRMTWGEFREAVERWRRSLERHPGSGATSLDGPPGPGEPPPDRRH